MLFNVPQTPFTRKGPQVRPWLESWPGSKISPLTLRYSSSERGMIYEKKKASISNDKTMFNTIDDPILMRPIKPAAMTMIQILWKGTVVRRSSYLPLQLMTWIYVCPERHVPYVSIASLEEPVLAKTPTACDYRMRFHLVPRTPAWWPPCSTEQLRLLCSWWSSPRYAWMGMSLGTSRSQWSLQPWRGKRSALQIQGFHWWRWRTTWSAGPRHYYSPLLRPSVQRVSFENGRDFESITNMDNAIRSFKRFLVNIKH